MKIRYRRAAVIGGGYKADNPLPKAREGFSERFYTVSQKTWHEAAGQLSRIRGPGFLPAITLPTQTEHVHFAHASEG